MALGLHAEAMAALEIAQDFLDVANKCLAHRDVRIHTEGGDFTSTGHAGTYTYAKAGVVSALAAVFGTATARFIYERHIAEGKLSVSDAVELWQKNSGY
jgi:hypothetical protein